MLAKGWITKILCLSETRDFLHRCVCTTLVSFSMKGTRVQQAGDVKGTRVQQAGGVKGTRVQQAGDVKGTRVQQAGGVKGTRVQQAGGCRCPPPLSRISLLFLSSTKTACASCMMHRQ